MSTEAKSPDQTSKCKQNVQSRSRFALHVGFAVQRLFVLERVYFTVLHVNHHLRYWFVSAYIVPFSWALFLLSLVVLGIDKSFRLSLQLHRIFFLLFLNQYVHPQPTLIFFPPSIRLSVSEFQLLQSWVWMSFSV